MSIAIDIAIQLAAIMGLSFALGAAANTLDAAAAQAVALVMVVGVIVGYPTAFETLSRGRTLGKIALGLRVVRDDGGPERFRQALLRALAEVVEIWLTLGVLALFTSLLNQQGKRLGDLWAGTVVVRERMPSQGGTVAWMPAPLQSWAAAADLSRVPDPLALSARQLIARWSDLEPTARTQMATRLATEIGAFVAPPSPPGTPAEAYLAAVLAERRRRDQLRLAGSHAPQAQVQPQPRTAPPAANQSRPTPMQQPDHMSASNGGFKPPG